MADPRVEQSKECLLEAELRLLERKPIDEISVSELCKTAGISRQTFYRLYSRKEDVLLERLQALLDEVYDADGPVPSIEETIERLGAILEREGRFLRCAFQSNLDFHIIHRFELLMKRLMEEHEDDAYHECMASFIAGGMYLTMKKWCIEGRSEEGWDYVENIKQVAAPLVESQRAEA